jgi:8-oxo-dGTP diphosphatase
MSDPNRPVTEVAAGILLDSEGRYLLGQRPEGKPYAGYWEVPGGKIEAGESVFAALKREDLVVLEHDYPHAYVRLHVSIIRKWTGIPKGCESQALSWQLLGDASPTVGPLLPAAWPMLEKLRLLKP